MTRFGILWGLVSMICPFFGACGQILNPSATVTLVAEDSEGGVVKDADFGVTFSIIDLLGKRRFETFRAEAVASGTFSAEGKTDGIVSYGVSKSGWYKSKGRVEFRRSDDGWEELGKPIKVLLREIRDPVPMYAKRMREGLPGLDEDIGFDFEAGDFVKPYGKGQNVDMIFHATAVQGELFHYESRIVVSFPNPGDGILEFGQSKYGQSEFQSPYEAPESGYQPEWIQIRKRQGPEASATGNFDRDRSYLFRVRTKLDQRGRVVSANYGKIYGDFMDFTYYFNPEPNNRNLEFDTDRNLLENSLKSFERVSKP